MQKNVLYKLTTKQKASLLHKNVFSINPYGRLGYTKEDRLGNRTYWEALETNPYAGIYRRHRIKGKMTIDKMPFYKPTNMQTEKQQAWRAKMAQAVAFWFTLSPAEKRFYELWGRKYKIGGYHKFLSEYLKSQYAELVK